MAKFCQKSSILRIHRHFIWCMDFWWVISNFGLGSLRPFTHETWKFPREGRGIDALIEDSEVHLRNCLRAAFPDVPSISTISRIRTRSYITWRLLFQHSFEPLFQYRSSSMLQVKIVIATHSPDVKTGKQMRYQGIFSSHNTQKSLLLIMPLHVNISNHDKVKHAPLKHLYANKVMTQNNSKQIPCDSPDNHHSRSWVHTLVYLQWKSTQLSTSHC